VTPRTQTRTRRPNRAEKREANRERILRAARAVFGARGFHGATIGEIADEAGLSNGAIYYNFESKEELFLALLDARMDERLQAIDAAFNMAGDDAATSRIALDYVENLKHNRDWIALFFEFVARAARGGDFRDRFAERFREFWEALAEIVDNQAREQDIELPLPGMQLAIALDLLGIGFMLPRIIDPDGVPDELLGQALGYLLRGVIDATR